MEIDKTERMLKNSLKNLEKNLECKLQDINARHSDFKNCLEKLFEELISKEYFVNKTEDELRRLHFLLLLSTDLPVCEELSCNRDLGHFVDFLPTLSPFLYLVLCERFELLKFIVESIRWTPAALAIEILVLVDAEIKHLQLRSYFELLAESLNAVFSRSYENCTELVPKHLTERFKILLLLFKDDDQEHKKKKIERHERNGHKWLALMRLVYSMTRIRFNLVSSVKPCDLYDFEMDDSCEEIKKDGIIEDLFEDVFFRCRCFADALDVETFMAWHEIRYDENSLQTAIGEKAYYLRELLAKYKDSELLPAVTSQLLTILEHMQRKPLIDRTAEQTLSKTELENEIARKMKLDIDFLKNVHDYLSIAENNFNLEAGKNLIRKLCLKSVTSDVDGEMMKNIGLSILRKMNYDEIPSFVEEFLNDFGIESIFYEPSLDLTPLIEQINTIDDDEENDLKVTKEVLLTSIRSSRQLLKMLLKSSCHDSNSRNKILETINKLKTVCLHTLKSNETDVGTPLMIAAILDFLKDDYVSLPVIDKNFFSDTVIFLSKNNLIDGNIYFDKCLLNSFFAEEKFREDVLIDLLGLIKTYIEWHDKLEFSTRKMLIQLAKILNFTRWSISNFTQEKMKVCEMAIGILKLLLCKYWSSLSSEDIQEVTNSLTNFSDLTRYYFIDVCSLSDPISIESKLIYLIHKPLSGKVEFIEEIDSNKDLCTTCMGKILPRCTLVEMQSMVENYCNGDYEQINVILDLISDGISLTFHCARQFCEISSTDPTSTYDCLGYTLNNFLNMLQKIIDDGNASRHGIPFVKYINRTAAVVKAFPPHLIDLYKFNMMKFITEILDKFNVSSTNVGKEELLRDLDRDARQLLVGLFAL